MGFQPGTHPSKHQQLSHNTFLLAHPAGLVTTSILAEKQALELLPSLIKQNSAPFEDKSIFIGSDCQSALVALAQGPLHNYAHSCTNISWSTTYQSYLYVANTYNCTFHIQYIPGHVGIQPNETIDQLAKSYADLPHLLHQPNNLYLIQN
jgi:hypothetical protein